MSDVALIVVPYDSGHRNRRMGAGPQAIIDAGIEKALKDAGHSVKMTLIELPDDVFPAENMAAFALAKCVSLAVRDSMTAGTFPIILSGNCNTALGTLSGIGNKDIGVMWFDAHGDLNTPDTSPSGFFDGMALAAAAGRCWKEAVSGIPGFTAVAEDRVVHFGARDFDRGESKLVAESEIEVVTATQVRNGLETILHARRDATHEVYLHLDLDVLDPTEGRANSYATDGGLSAAELTKAVSEIGSAFRIKAVALTAYDPAFDPDNKIAQIAIGLATQVAAATVA